MVRSLAIPVLAKVISNNHRRSSPLKDCITSESIQQVKQKKLFCGFLSLETSDAYTQAKKVLADRFGNPFLIADAYRKKINEWPKIPPNDGANLRKYSDFLLHCQTAVKEIKYLKVLDDPDENQKMTRKLPRHLIDRWSREVDR